VHLNPQEQAMASSKGTSRYIILPTRGFVATANTGDAPLSALLSMQSPGLATLKRSRSASPALKIEVLASLHENGPKLVEMTAQQAFELGMNNPGLRVVPEVRYQVARAPQVEVASGKKAFPTATLNKLRLSLVLKVGALPVPEVTVVAFTNFAKRIGAKGVSTAKGLVTLALPASTKTLERVYLYAEHTAWPMLLRNVPVNGGPLALPAIDLAFRDSRVLAHAPFKPGDGRGVKVGVLDTGCGPHAAINVAKGVCTVFGDRDFEFTDTRGHGTHVAGVIAAVSAQFNGLAPAAALHVYRVFPRNGLGASNFDIANAIDQAVTDGCDLLNLSLGGGPMDPVTDEAIKAARARGTVCVIAAGNEGGAVANPGTHPLALCVSALGFKGAWPKGATQDEDVTTPAGHGKSYIAAFSNTGLEIDLTGPGCGIISTYPKERFAVMDGTSMACPCVTGAIARRLARAPAVLGARRDASRADSIVQLATAATRNLGFAPARQGAGLRT